MSKSLVMPVELWRGAVERITADHVIGWAVDFDAPDPVTIRLVSGASVLLETTADVPRPDIERAHGRLWAGFRVALPAAALQLRRRDLVVEAFVGGAWQTLPRLISLAAELDRDEAAAVIGGASPSPPATAAQQVASPALALRPVVVVVGCHRSGTSLCANILSVLGIDMADQPHSRGTPEPDNPRGHWERWELVGWHDRILGYLGRGFFTPYHDLPLPEGWWVDPGVVALRDEIAAFLARRMRDEYFGFKDPRTIRLMPMWSQIYRRLGLEPKFVFCLRDPMQVARSLRHRDGLDSAAGLYRWLTYLADFFNYLGDADFCTIEYESWFRNGAATLAKLCAFVGVPEVSPSRRHAVAEIVDRTLRHDDDDEHAEQPLIRSAYHLARHADAEPEARRNLASLAADFAAIRALERPLQSVFGGAEPVSLISFEETVPDTEAEMQALRSQVIESRRARESLEAALAVAEADREWMRDKISKLETGTEALQATLLEIDTALIAAEEELETLRAKSDGATRR